MTARGWKDIANNDVSLSIGPDAKVTLRNSYGARLHSEMLLPFPEPEKLLLQLHEDDKPHDNN